MINPCPNTLYGVKYPAPPWDYFPYSQMINGGKMSYTVSGNRMKFTAISDGSFALDGGLMYGIVPKVFWRKWHEVDDLNRIRLGMWCLVCEHPDGLIVVDTGCGDKLSEKQAKIFDLARPQGDMLSCFKAQGFNPEDVRAVVLSHLHFDHSGGVTRMDDEGSYQLQFPNASVYTTRTEYKDAVDINERTRGSYFPNTLKGYEPGTRAYLLEEEKEILPGVHLMPAPGHTRGHQIVLFDDGEFKLAYWGDLIPMSTFSYVPYIAAIDNYPMETLAQKKALLSRAKAEGWHQFFCHNMNNPFGGPPE